MPNKTKKTKGKKKAGVKSTAKQVQAMTLNRPSVATMSGLNPSSLHLVCGLNDPFCDHAIGAKYSGFGRVRTLTVPYHYRTSIATNATGDGGCLLVPNFLNQPVLPGVFTGATGAYGTMVGTTILSGVTSYRIVTFGAIVRCFTSPLNTTGMLCIRTFSPKTGASLLSITSTTYNCDESRDMSLKNVDEVCINVKRTDNTSKDLIDPTTTVATGGGINTWVSPGFQVVQVALFGAPVSVPVLDVEVFVNYEVTLDDGVSTQLLATPSPVNNPLVEKVSNLVTAETKSIVSGGALTFGKYIVNSAIKTAVAVGVGMITKSPSAVRGTALLVD